MKKNVGTIVFFIILMLFVVLYLSLSGKQTDKTLSQKTEVSQTDVSIQESETEKSQPVSDEKVILPSSQHPSSETLRQEAEQRFEKLMRIEETSGTPVERGDGLRVQIEIPIPSEPAQTE
ncbi:hypothetical protein U27_03018 [Candidatus Vecturithrix granuli]|uniref:Uncharacterized protein n=1 Tax=Vecturithrix granuli TaxID=1499967 RepID=A0A081BUQ1_VECG1|nr:hypothetical protein U27_03018 [Candidatus Vecturithrix granuli]